MMGHFSCRSKYTTAIQVISVQVSIQKFKIYDCKLKNKITGIDLLLINTYVHI